MGVDGISQGACPCSQLYLPIGHFRASDLLVSLAGSFFPTTSSHLPKAPPLSPLQGSPLLGAMIPQDAMHMLYAQELSRAKHKEPRTPPLEGGLLSGPPPGAPCSSAASTRPLRGFHELSTGPVWSDPWGRSPDARRGRPALPPDTPGTGRWPKLWARGWRAAGTG